MKVSCRGFPSPKGKNLSDLIDELDARILELIQEDASVSVADLAERVGLSPSPCWRRIKRLEDLGVIKKRVTVLDPDKLGLGFEVYAAVKLSLPSRANLEAFEARLDAWPEVVSCATVTGHEDYMLRIMTRDMHAYDDFLRDKLLASDLVSGVESRIIMRSVKTTTAVPIGLALGLRNAVAGSGNGARDTHRDRHPDPSGEDK